MNLFLPSCESHFPDKCTHLTFSFGLNEENTIVAFLHRLFKLGFTMESSFSLVNSHFVFPSLNAWRSIIMQAKIFVLWFIRPPLYPMNVCDHMSGAMHTPTFLPWDMSDAEENDNDQSKPYNRILSSHWGSLECFVDSMNVFLGKKITLPAFCESQFPDIRTHLTSFSDPHKVKSLQ